MAKYWGFNTKDIDRSVRPQDDFYTYANGTWLKKNKIPPTEARWGSFTMLRYKTEHQLRAIIRDLLALKRAPQGSPKQLVRDMYLSASDIKRRGKLGVAPITPLRLLLSDIKNAQDFLRILARLHVLGVSGCWGVFMEQDPKDSSTNLLYMWQGGLGMPDRDYYLLDKPEQKRVREEYKSHIRRLLKLAKFKAKDVVAIEASVMKIETALAKASMPKEDSRDAQKTYHKMTLSQFQRLCPAVNWDEYFARTHAKGLRELNVGQPEFFKALNSLLRTIPLEEWKRYLEWHVINDTANLLSETFVRENFRYYGTALIGQKKMKPVWRRALGAVNVVGESLGKIYVERYFPSQHKRMMDELVSDLFDVYEERIKNLDWMSPATKKKAVKKLRMMSRKIGYPTKWEHYAGLEIDPQDYFGNMLRANEWHHIKAMKKLRKPVDRGEWHMFPHTVNAYCNFSLNEIVFPAGILQWPFFDPKADAAVNYAGIGTVIGHEMTHAFDDQGAKFDGKGNMVGWWTPADRKRFEGKGAIVVKQYDAYQVGGGVNVNGKLTLGENIADFGGLTIGWDAYKKYLEKHGRKDVEGLSPEQRFFLGYAQMERELKTPEAAKVAALTDPHAPGDTRINGPLANFEPFYEMFKVKKGDKLYREPKKRVVIW